MICRANSLVPSTLSLIVPHSTLMSYIIFCNAFSAMCGQQTGTLVPCKRKTGGARACPCHANQKRQYPVQLTRLDKNGREWAVYSTPYFLYLTALSDTCASYTVGSHVPDSALYAVCNTRHILTLRPGDRIETCVEFGRRYLFVLLQTSGSGELLRVGPVAFLSVYLPLLTPRTWSQRWKAFKQWVRHNIQHVSYPLPEWACSLPLQPAL